MNRPRLHVFVCGNERPIGGRPSCGQSGGHRLAQELTTAVAEHAELWDKVRINTCDCLGPCFDGPNLVVYPEGIWYTGVTVADIGELVREHLIGGRVVDRLRWQDDDESPEPG